MTSGPELEDFNEFMCDYCGLPIGECEEKCAFWHSGNEEEFCPDCCHIQHSGEEVNYLLKCEDCS